MSPAETPDRRRALSEYNEAVQRVAEGLEAVWLACESLDGLNLPEALSYALGVAAKAIGGRTLADTGKLLEPHRFHDLVKQAGALLVRHRPGSWEAQHVRALVFPPDLIPDVT